jgi:diguanylate cyclase (GGDEF)-like protein
MHRDTPFNEGMPPAQILIVDDDELIRRLLAHVVSPLGQIILAENGPDALQILRSQPIDLILLDLEMPGMDGISFCTTVKSDPAFADLPILFVSSHADGDSEARGLDAGAVDYIIKPPSPPIVRARVRTHLILRQRTQQLLRLAWVDGLTGLANRRAFDQSLSEEWRRARRNKTPLSLAMIDIDHFKLFNDHYGHQAGDDCLKMVAATLAKAAERPGELVSRYGGEEFGVILPFCDEQDAMRLGEKMRARVGQLKIPHKTSPGGFVSISCGVATLTGNNNHPSLDLPAETDLINAADQALYGAKHGGRDRVQSSAVLITLPEE